MILWVPEVFPCAQRTEILRFAFASAAEALSCDYGVTRTGDEIESTITHNISAR